MKATGHLFQHLKTRRIDTPLDQAEEIDTDADQRCQGPFTLRPEVRQRFSFQNVPGEDR